MSKKLFLYLTLSLIIYCWSFDIAQRDLIDSRPNIIFVLADDLSYRDLSCYGQTRYQTPNLDALAVNGVRFSQAYSAAPECAPSRGCLLTGLHTGHGPIRVNSSARGQDILQEKDITIAALLKEAGYRTGFAGKWGIGLPKAGGLPYQQGFDYAFGFYDQRRAHTFIPDYLWENDKKIFYPQNKGFEMNRRYDYVGNKAQNTYDKNGKLYINELKDPYGYAYSENEIEKAAMSFIQQESDKPFFLYYATQLPHGPVIVDDIGPLAQPDSINQLSREWGAMVVKLDQFVGQLIRQLKAQGVYENTVIFFASDNGYSMCGYTERGNGPDWPDDPWLQNKGPFTGGKFSVLEGGCRVPFFASWPGHFKPQVYDEPVWLPDFFPTALELAQQKQPAYPLDGNSLVPLLEGRIDDFKEHEFLYFSKGPEQAVRMGPWKAYRKKPGAKTNLYLVSEDTYTQRDLASLHPDLIARMERIMETEHTPHPWYRNPWESAEEFAAKKQKAVATGNKLPIYRPNGIDKFPWEK